MLLRCGGSYERPLLEELGRLPLKFGCEGREGALLRGWPPPPAQGGRSLMMRAEFCAGALAGWFEPPKPCDGRSFIERGELCAGAFVGRFEPPKPCGARPRSVALPWASQVREFPGRCAELFLISLPADRVEFGIAEGGRFCASSRCRAVIPELAFALPGRFSN